MKKFFTYLLASAAFCMIGTVNAMAQDEAEEEDLMGDWFIDVKDPTNPVDEPTPATVDYNVGNELGGGGVIIGTSSLFDNIYVDLSDYDYLIAVTNGGFPRIYMNRIGGNDNGRGDGNCTKEYDPKTPAIDGNIQWVKDRYYTISEDQTTYIVNLKKIIEDFGYAHLNGIKFGWGVANAICESLVVGKGSLPTGVEKVSVKEVLAGQRFNVAGQKVGNNAKGLYIMNGKKYIK